jgi:hypothetical protein
MRTDALGASAAWAERRVWFLCAAIYVSILLATSIAMVPSRGEFAAGDESPNLGCGSSEISHTLASGSAWRMCARIHPIKGLTLENLQFKPASGSRELEGWLPVVDSLYLAQLVVPYDTGTVAFNDVTDYGFGDNQLLSQSDLTCPGTKVPVEQSFMRGTRIVERTIPGICVDEISTGLAWNAQETYAEGATRYSAQGRALEVSSITKISWYEYQQKVTLTDQGAIHVGLGATGDLAPSSLFFPDDPAVGWPVGAHDNPDTRGHATSHWHNAVYRVDFGIGSGPQQVEQWDYALADPEASTRIEGTRTVITHAFAASDKPDPQTWWRVVNTNSLNRDGHPRSYEIVNDSTQNPYDPLTRPQVSFTNAHACQEYASGNLNAGCPGLSVPDYVAAETAPLSDPVAWVSVGFHHVARDEDQSPMPAHWQEFSLVPRDLLAQQAVTPLGRSCVNGGPFTLAESCLAVNEELPEIHHTTITVKPGAVLTGHAGRWRTTRVPLNFQFLWLRDGEPISHVGTDGLTVSATGDSYTVSQADAGHDLSVQVTASGSGIVPGVAESAAVEVQSSTSPTAGPGTPTTSSTDANPQSPAPHPLAPNASGSPDTRPPARVKVHVKTVASRARVIIKVNGPRGKATGKVKLRARDWRRTVSLAHGRATIEVKRLAVGRSPIKVRFLGDDAYTSTQVIAQIRW